MQTPQMYNDQTQYGSLRIVVVSVLVWYNIVYGTVHAVYYYHSGGNMKLSIFR